MSKEPEDDFFEHPQNEDDSPTPEELAIWLSEFMNQGQKAEKMYRVNLCSIIVDRIWQEFGVEGMCELMVSIDRRAGWISDILIEDADIHDVLFAQHGVFDNNAIEKARMSEQLVEFNRKIWRLRRKYAKLIAEEIFAGPTGESEGSPSPTQAD